MRELTIEETESVTGGAGLLGAAIGGVIGGGNAYFEGEGVGGIIKDATFGAASGFFGGLAGATTGFARAMNVGYSLEMGFMAAEPNS